MLGLLTFSLKQLSDDPWVKEIPEKYKVGDVITGKVTKLTNFGAFLELGKGIEGLLHISELSSEKVNNPADVVNIGDDLEVRVIRIEPEARKIGLSLKKMSGAEGRSEIPATPNEDSQKPSDDEASAMNT